MADKPGMTDDLRKLIADRQLLAVVGSGVSIASTGNAPAASWAGLLRTGIDHCVRFAGVTARWGRLKHDALDYA